MTSSSPWAAGHEWIELPLHSAGRRPGAPLRLRSWWARARLDRQLADGADPTTEPLLAYRARQLTGIRSRRRIAGGIERAVGEAERAFTGMGARVPVQRRIVFGARPTLLALARALRMPAPVGAQGVALALRLLTDGAGPLYFAGDPRTVAEAAAAAMAALDDGHRH